MTDLNEQIKKLNDKIKEMQAEIAKLEAEAEKPTIDESYIGHLVEVRDSGGDWVLTMLKDIWDHAPYPFREGKCGWEQCRPRQDGPSVGPWIKHDGGKCPVGNYEFVVVVDVKGYKECDGADMIDWQHVTKYAVIKTRE